MQNGRFWSNLKIEQPTEFAMDVIYQADAIGISLFLNLHITSCTGFLEWLRLLAESLMAAEVWSTIDMSLYYPLNIGA